MQSFQLERLALDDRRDLAGFRPQGADNGAPIGSRMRAEQTVRIMVRSTDEAVEGVALDRCHGRDRAGLDRRCVGRRGPRGRDGGVGRGDRFAHRGGLAGRL